MIQKKKLLMIALFMALIFIGTGLLTVPTALAGNWALGIKNKLNPIVTTRDDKGVWFIKGDDSAPIFDVFEAMGYAVATDRLWQAEKYRRMGRGRLAEVFGPDQLASDIQVRTTGYSDQEYTDGFNALDQESKDALLGYCAGFNRRINEVKKDRTQLPFEFQAVGASLGIDFVPEDWTPTDILAWATNMLRFFDGEATERGQIDNMALYQKLMALFPTTYNHMFADMRWTQDPDAVTYIQGDPRSAMAKASTPAFKIHPKLKKLLAGNTYDFEKIYNRIKKNDEQIIANLKKINAFVKMGSYAWVVDGDKTATGNPIIYSGPQMDHAFRFSVPSIVTEGSIKAGGLNISGMTIPGMPAIVIGRTPHHAWSMQVGHAHTLDYFLDDPSMVFLHRTEVIKVAGQPDHILPVYRTVHGPVINSDPVITWKYAHWGKEFGIVGTYLDLARAQSMDDFGTAIRKVTLSQHYCYADRDGNIAYWMSGFDPVRDPDVNTRFPQVAGTCAEWPDPLELKPLATDRNSQRGFYSGWNSKASVDYANPPNTSSYYFGPFHRAHVLEDYLASNNNLTFENIRDLALYIASTDSVRNRFLSSECDTYGDGGNPWKFVKTDFMAAIQADPTADRNAAVDILNAWDGHFVEGGPSMWATGTDRSDGWVLMNEWISEVLYLTFNDELAMDESRIVLFNMLLHGLPGFGASLTNRYDWFSNLQDPGAPQTAYEIIVQALDNALATLGERPWGVGKRGQMTYTHEIVGPLHSLPTSSRSTYAHCVEMGPDGPVRIESMLPLGESGNILMDAQMQPVFDPNFFSMAPVYDTFLHRPFPVNE